MNKFSDRSSILLASTTQARAWSRFALRAFSYAQNKWAYAPDSSKLPRTLTRQSARLPPHACPSQKVALGSAARLQTRSGRFRGAADFLRQKFFQTAFYATTKARACLPRPLVSLFGSCFLLDALFLPPDGLPGTILHNRFRCGFRRRR